MAKPFSLQTVLELMQTRTDEATRQLATLLAAEQDAQRKLAMLQHYRDEYFARFRSAAQNGLRPADWRNYQDFLGRIDEAVEQQRHAVAQSEKSTAAGQSHWREQNKRLKAIDTLSQRHEARERHRESRLDQKQQDEYSTRKFSRGQGHDHE